MLTVVLVLMMILACGLLFAASAGYGSRGRWQLGWLGLFVWALVVLIGMLAGVRVDVD